MATLSELRVLTRLIPKFTLAGPEVSADVIEADALNPGETTYTSSSTTPVSLYFAESYTLSGSGTQTQTITLDSFTDLEGASKSGTDLKVNVVRLIADSSNSGTFTVEGAAVDPYELFGSGNAVDLPPGVTLAMECADQLSDIGPTSGGGATDIKLTGTGGDTITVELGIG